MATYFAGFNATSCLMDECARIGLFTIYAYVRVGRFTIDTIIYLYDRLNTPIHWGFLPLVLVPLLVVMFLIWCALAYKHWLDTFPQKKDGVDDMDPTPQLPQSEETDDMGALLVHWDALRETALDAGVALLHLVYLLSITSALGCVYAYRCVCGKRSPSSDSRPPKRLGMAIVKLCVVPLIISLFCSGSHPARFIALFLVVVGVEIALHDWLFPTRREHPSSEARLLDIQWVMLHDKYLCDEQVRQHLPLANTDINGLDYIYTANQWRITELGFEPIPNHCTEHAVCLVFRVAGLHPKHC
jgi:hypothetical protein